MLTLPLIGTSETFAYGVWSTLSEKNFWAYVESFDSGEQAPEEWARVTAFFARYAPAGATTVL